MMPAMATVIVRLTAVVWPPDAAATTVSIHRPGGSWYVPVKVPPAPTVRCNGGGGATGTGVGLPDATGGTGPALAAVTVTSVPAVVPAIDTAPPLTAAPSAGLVRAMAGPTGASGIGTLTMRFHGGDTLAVAGSVAVMVIWFSPLLSGTSRDQPPELSAENR